MALVKYQFRPGINKELTSYANEGGWRDSDKIRFRFGKPEKIGGWSKNSVNSFLELAEHYIHIKLLPLLLTIH